MEEVAVAAVVAASVVVGHLALEAFFKQECQSSDLLRVEMLILGQPAHPHCRLEPALLLPSHFQHQVAHLASQGRHWGSGAQLLTLRGAACHHPGPMWVLSLRPHRHRCLAHPGPSPPVCTAGVQHQRQSSTASPAWGRRHRHSQAAGPQGQLGPCGSLARAQQPHTRADHRCHPHPAAHQWMRNHRRHHLPLGTGQLPAGTWPCRRHHHRTANHLCLLHRGHPSVSLHPHHPPAGQGHPLCPPVPPAVTKCHDCPRGTCPWCPLLRLALGVAAPAPCHHHPARGPRHPSGIPPAEQAPCHHHLPSAGTVAPRGLYLPLPSCLPGLGWRTRGVGPGHHFPQTGRERVHHHHHHHLQQRSGTASRSRAMMSGKADFLSILYLICHLQSHMYL